MSRGINSGLLLTIALPAFAILASVGAAVVAFTRGDVTLPDEYHWEGRQLDNDFAAANRAAALGVRARLRETFATGTCLVTLRLNAAPPPALRLTLIHATRPELDREVTLHRFDDGYEGFCGTVPSGHWHLELTDAAAGWSVRQDFAGTPDGVRIEALPEPR